MTQLNTKFSRAEDSPGLLLWQLSNKWQADQRVALKPFNLTHVQFVLLASLTYLADANGLTQKQLAEFAHTDIMMTSQVVRKLEQKGFIKRTVSKQDKRAFALVPSEAGIKLVNQAIKTVETVDKNFFSKAGDDLPNLIKIMQQLRS